MSGRSAPPEAARRVVLERLRADLAVDLALSDGQLRRHYDLASDSLAGTGLQLVPAFLAPSHGSYRTRSVTFVVAGKKQARLEPVSLRHLAGVAELRHLLGAPRETWESRAASRYRPRMPDALWRSPWGVVAIEYDTGSYSRRQLLAKAAWFAPYALQVWGTPSRRRLRHLRHHLGRTASTVVVRYARWD